MPGLDKGKKVYVRLGALQLKKLVPQGGYGIHAGSCLHTLLVALVRSTAPTKTLTLTLTLTRTLTRALTLTLTRALTRTLTLTRCAPPGRLSRSSPRMS